MWQNININIQNVETETAKSVLIKMPNNSQYKGFKFWHPAKLVRKGRNSYAISISFTDDFTFKLVKYGNGKYNKYDVIDQIEIDAQKLKEAFGVMDENITAPQYKSDYETHKPEPLEAKEVEALEDLKDE